MGRAATTTYNWEKEQKNLDSYKQYKVTIEGVELYFVQEKYEAEDAIPIILNYGWPGTFQQFLPVITLLTQPAMLASGKNVSFHVVVPSLPGFA